MARVHHDAPEVMFMGVGIWMEMGQLWRDRAGALVAYCETCGKARPVRIRQVSEDGKEAACIPCGEVCLGD